MYLSEFCDWCVRNVADLEMSSDQIWTSIAHEYLFKKVEVSAREVESSTLLNAIRSIELRRR